MVVKHSVVATFADEAGAEINKTEWNADHVVDDNSFTIAKTALLQAALDAKELLSAKDAANGYAGLSATSKLSGSQQTYGTTTNTACEGDDSRLSDDRVPTTHLSTKVSDFAAAVGLIHDATPLDQFTAPTSDIDLNNNKIVNLTTPTAAADAANKSYVDALSNGLAVKAAVNVATTENILLEGNQVIDGITTSDDMRVLVKDQTNGEDNGYYLAKAIAWVRTSDADVSAEISSGMFAWVITGTANGAAGFALTTAGPIVLDTTVLAFTQFSGLGQVVAGSALTKTANTIDVAVDSVGIEVNSDALRLKDDGVVSSKILADAVTTVKILDSNVTTAKINDDAITTPKILDDAVTLAKIQNIATTTMLGRATAGSGSVEELSQTQIQTIVNGGSKPLFYQIPVDVVTGAGGGNVFGVAVTLAAGSYRFEGNFMVQPTAPGGEGRTSLTGTATLANVSYSGTHHLGTAIAANSIGGTNSAASAKLFTAPAIAFGSAQPVSWSGSFDVTVGGTLEFHITYHTPITLVPTGTTATHAAGGSMTITPVAANGTWA
jgi:hypothetical protein